MARDRLKKQANSPYSAQIRQLLRVLSIESGQKIRLDVSAVTGSYLECCAVFSYIKQTAVHVVTQEAFFLSFGVNDVSYRRHIHAV